MRLLYSIVPLFFLSACVDNDPIITGHRDAGTEAAAPVPLVTAAPDEDYVDPPTCRRCSDVLETSLVRGILCRKNAEPSSSSLANVLVDCTCSDKCVAACGGFCNGSALDAKCRACMEGECTSLVVLCSNDKVGGS